jgi:hypothetical protein
MGHDGYVIGDENLGFIIRRNFVTSNLCCYMVLVVIILYFIVISMIFTIIHSFEMYCARWNQYKIFWFTYEVFTTLKCIMPKLILSY